MIREPMTATTEADDGGTTELPVTLAPEDITRMLAAHSPDEDGFCPWCNVEIRYCSVRLLHDALRAQAREHCAFCDEAAADAERAEGEQSEALADVMMWQERCSDLRDAVEALADEWEAVESDDMTVPWPVADALLHKAGANLRALLASNADADGGDSR